MRSSHTKPLSLALAMVLACWGVARAQHNTTIVFGNGASTNLAANLIIGDTGTNNVLIITNGSKVANIRGVIGNQAGSDYNSVLVSGLGSTWTNRDTVSPFLFVVGATGSFNQVVVTNGGRLLSGLNGDASLNVIGQALTSSNNTVIVTGTNSSWIMRGSLRLGVGQGNQLTVANGALVSSTAALIIGDDVTGDPAVPGRNRVLVTGSNSTLNAGDSSVGDGQRRLLIGRLTGHNELIITNGGKVNSFTVVFGVNNNVSSTNLALVTGVGSQWNVNGDVMIGRLRNELRVEDGGLMTVNSNVLLGVTVSGANTSSNNNRIAVNGGSLIITNAGGTALLNVVRGTNLLANGGSITTDRLLATNGAHSILVFHGGTLNTKSTTVTNNTIFVAGNGANAATLNLQGGTHIFANNLLINTNATLKGTGTVLGSTTIWGTLAPGNSPGLLSLGNLTLATNSTYEVEIDGTIPGTLYDQVDVTGSVVLSNGLLRLDVGFEPVTNDTFTIINNDAGDTVVGTFLGLGENAFIDASANGFDAFFRISYVGGTGNDVVLVATIPEPSVVTLAFMATAGLLMRLRRRQ